MLKTVSLFFLSIVYFSVFSQIPSGKLFVLCEGTAGGHGSVGFVDFQSNLYQVIDSNLATYGNQITYIDGKIYAVDGNGDISIYDPNSLAKIDSILGQSARNIYAYQNELLITSIAKPYFRSLALASPHTTIYSLDTTLIRSAREEIVIKNNKAFISGYNNDSIVSVVDLVNKQLITNLQTAANPFKIISFGQNIYAACYSYNANFTSNTQLFEISPTTNSITQNWFFPEIDGLSAGDTAIYMKTGTGKLATFIPQTQALDTNGMAINAYILQYDRVKKALFYSQTDYFSTGFVGFTYNHQSFPLISTDISPRSFLFLGTDSTALSNDKQDFSLHYKLYPNPIKKELVVSLPNYLDNLHYTITIYDMSGNTIHTNNITSAFSVFNMENIAAGLYFITISDGERKISNKFIKL